MPYNEEVCKLSEHTAVAFNGNYEHKFKFFTDLRDKLLKMWYNLFWYYL